MSEENVIQPENNQENIKNPVEENLHGIGKINPEVSFVYDFIVKTRRELKKVIVGQDDLIDLLITGMLSNGHVLLEGVPGIAKTLAVKLLAQTLDVDFKRIQFTPDLMPSDVIGTNVFNMKTSDFYFRKGPVFSNLILIDEINRAPAKTQAALMEVMEEKQVTVDGETHLMSYPLFIVATQNPVEQEGTYKLPEAQLDRFLFRIKLSYPDLREEKDILVRFRNGSETDISNRLQKVVSADALKKCSDIINSVHIKDELLDYIAQIIHDTRNNGDLYLGASPRASLSVMRTSKAYAAMQGRDFVTPDDIQNMVYPVLNHRIVLSPEREMEGFETEDIIKNIVKKIEVPR